MKIKPDRLLWLAPYFVSLALLFFIHFLLLCKILFLNSEEIYILSGLMLLFTVLIASLFYVVDVSGWYLPFRVYGIASVVICEIGYLYYGTFSPFSLLLPPTLDLPSLLLPQLLPSYDFWFGGDVVERCLLFLCRKEHRSNALWQWEQHLRSAIVNKGT